MAAHREVATAGVARHRVWSTGNEDLMRSGALPNARDRQHLVGDAPPSAGSGVIRVLAAAVAACGLLLAAGCADPADPIVAPQTRQLTPADAPGLFVVESRAFGPIVVDGQGFVLYRFDADSNNPPTSRCVDSCTDDWLPVAAVDNVRVVGIDRQLVGRLTRPDGSTQLTLAGWPLYGYSGDRMPGDVNGQDSDSRWSLVAPDGNRIGPHRTASVSTPTVAPG
jgi:predicted lipoprotein with Yx(FWY)xxD motif